MSAAAVPGRPFRPSLAGAGAFRQRAERPPRRRVGLGVARLLGLAGRVREGWTGRTKQHRTSGLVVGEVNGL